MTGWKNILVVDDEKMIREAVTSYLEKQGHHVFPAETGQEALHILEKQKVSFVILEKEPVDLLELSQAVQYAFEQELDKKQLTCKVSGESAVVSGDQKRLHQVIFSLVSNAIKYSTEGGCINIDVRNETDTATLIIEDQGIGISEKDLPLIFERFYRTDRSRNRKTGGAGIGLTIAKAVVLGHNGKITVESKEGYGSRFVITVPKR